MKTGKRKILAYLLAMLIMPWACMAAENVVISEVLYDPIITESGGEAVELYNPTASAIDISGYVIKTESSATDATVPSGTTLEADQYYLIADSGWLTSKDNMTWPDADHEEALTFGNSDAGVALIHPNGTTLDAVGWGDPAGIDAGLWEGMPATPSVAGNSLIRADADTDDNSVDFIDGMPDLKNSVLSAPPATDPGEPITLEVSIQNNKPAINSITITADDDNSTAGVQAIPVPEGKKMLPLIVEVSDPDGSGSITSVIAEVTGPDGTKNFTLSKVKDLNSTTAEYNGTAILEFYDAPGQYNVTVIASDMTSNSQADTSFEYISMAALSVDSTALSFIGATLGSTSTITGDFALSTADSPTIRNAGNTPLDIGIYGTDLVDGANAIGISNLKYSLDNDFGSVLSGTISKALQTTTIGLANAQDSVISLGFQLSVPETTPEGNYTGNITVVAVSS